MRRIVINNPAGLFVAAKNRKYSIANRAYASIAGAAPRYKSRARSEGASYAGTRHVRVSASTRRSTSQAGTSFTPYDVE